MDRGKLILLSIFALTLAATVLIILAPRSADQPFAAKQEVVPDFGALIPAHEPLAAADAPVIQLERVTTAVPWPRGMAFVDGELVVLARGRHRRAGGVDPNIDDRAGALFAVDPAVSEPVTPGRLASETVRNNARVIAEPAAPLLLYDRNTDPLNDTRMDRPYCTLIYDDASRNFFICGFSGVDSPGGTFRKNATDSIHRYDMRDGRWRAVEMHDASVVPAHELTGVVSNEHYPHHDPDDNAPPHGWLNGADGGCVAGEYLYVVAKDNHRVVQYDLAAVRDNPDAGPPDSRPVITEHVTIHHPGGPRKSRALGPSAAVARDGFLYISYRTSSIILRFGLDERGGIADPDHADLIAVFEPWDKDKGRSANLIDLAFNSRGELFVSCATEGRIWRIGKPDPARPFYGNDQTDRPTTAPPYVDLRALTGKESIGCGNIVFDARDRLYICSGTSDTASQTLRGVVYRAVERAVER